MRRNSSLPKLITLVILFLNLYKSGKLQNNKAEVRYYTTESKMIYADFEYYVKPNNVQYGTRYGVDVFKVFFIFYFINTYCFIKQLMYFVINVNTHFEKTKIHIYIKSYFSIGGK